MFSYESRVITLTHKNSPHVTQFLSSKCQSFYSWRKAECIAMSCCCRNGRSRKIGPGSDSNNGIIEIRPKRHLRIQHLNARPRDSALEEELQVCLDIYIHCINANMIIEQIHTLKCNINEKKLKH